MYRSPNHNTDDLKQQPIKTWASVLQSVINEAVDRWQTWLCAYVKTESHHFEPLL